MIQTVKHSVQKHYDCIVVGAGPAGAAFVKTLQNNHSKLSILVIEKFKFPRDKICGDALTYLSVPMIKEIFPEIQHLIPTRSFTRKYKIHYDPAITIGRNDGVLDLIERKALDHLLWNSLDKSTIDVLEEAFVYEVIKTREEVKGIRYRFDNRRFEATADLVIGADGSHSVIRRKTGSTDTDDVFPAVRQYFSHLSHPQTGFIFLVDPPNTGYFWIFPFFKNNQWWANCGYGAKRGRIKQRYEDLKQHPLIREYLAGAKVHSPVRGFPINMAASSFNRIKLMRPLWGPGYILLGDAACLVHPHTGEGISSALYSGKLCAELIAQGLQEQSLGREYQRGVVDFLQNKFALTTTAMLFKIPCLLPDLLRVPYLKLLAFL
ncbi:MAG: FAD-dependent monooxygenase [Limisphaerales bacterium]